MRESSYNAGGKVVSFWAREGRPEGDDGTWEEVAGREVAGRS